MPSASTVTLVLLGWLAVALPLGTLFGLMAHFGSGEPDDDPLPWLDLPPEHQHQQGARDGANR